MFNRSEIMKAAWVAYRSWHASRERIFGPKKFNREQFAALLRYVWKQTRSAQMTPTQRRALQIRAELEALTYKSFRYDTVRIETQLRTELAALAA